MAVRESNLEKPIFVSPPGTNRGPSTAIWGNCPILRYTHNPAEGFHHFNDFMGIYTLAHTQSITKLQDEGLVYGMTGANAACTIATSSTTTTGEVIMNTGADNVGATLVGLAGGPGAVGGLIELPAGKDFWFEARIKSSLAANDILGFFLGIVDKNLVADAAIIADTGVLVDNNYVGFHVIEDDYDTIDCVWRNKGVAVLTGGEAKGKLVTNTYTKLGITGQTNKLRFYQDGVLIYESLAGAMAAANFPNVAGENMCLALTFMGEHATAAATTMDWWKFARAL